MDPTLRIYEGVRKPRNLLVGRANCYVTRVVGPIQARGGMGGRWGELRPFLRVIGVQHVLCYLRRTTMLYRVDVQWGDKKIRHYSFTRNQALEWARQYPQREDIFVIVRNMTTNETVTHRYFR